MTENCEELLVSFQSHESSMGPYFDQKLDETRAHKSEIKIQNQKLIEEFERIKTEEESDKQDQFKKKATEYDEEICRLQSIIIKLEEEKKQLKSENKQLKEFEQNLRKRITIIDSMNEKEIKKNIELKEAYEKLEEELNIKRSWKQEISMIENNDQSKISEMNDDFSKYVSEIQIETGKVNCLQKSIIERDEEIKKLVERNEGLDKMLRQKENQLASLSKKPIESEQILTQDQVSEDSNPQPTKLITIGDILDLVGKFVDRLESREILKVKNILTCFVEQKVSVYC